MLTQLELLEHMQHFAFFFKVLISRNKQEYLNQKGKKPAFEEHVFIVENDLKGLGRGFTVHIGPVYLVQKY